MPLSQVRLEGNRPSTKDRELILNDEGFRRLARQLGAPADYLESLPQGHRNGLLSYHLKTVGRAKRGLNDLNSRIYFRDGAFADLGRADLNTLGSMEVLNAVRDGFETDADSFEAFPSTIRNESFSLDLVTPRISAEVRRGDVIQAGVRIEHHYTGDRATTVVAFVVRVICTNGMTHRECLKDSGSPSRTRRLNADRENAAMLQIEQVRDRARDVRKQLEPKLEDIRKLADQRADKSELKKLLQQARMGSKTLLDQLDLAWKEEGGEETAFGLFNALTRLATHGAQEDTRKGGTPRISERQMTTLARLAGIYANRSRHFCPHCLSLLH